MDLVDRADAKRQLLDMVDGLSDRLLRDEEAKLILVEQIEFVMDSLCQIGGGGGAGSLGEGGGTGGTLGAAPGVRYEVSEFSCNLSPLEFSVKYRPAR